VSKPTPSTPSTSRSHRESIPGAVQSASIAPSEYRADIDGLRAIAVLAVVLDHLKVPPFSGGYVGVDVFFVISGFLITTVLLADIRSGQPSLFRFYERRARRILPALFAVSFATCLAALLLFMPRELSEFGQSLSSVGLFASNFYFWSEVDYFDIPATSKPLLHTWSLAVEEQFYVLYPLLLLVTARWFKGSALLIFLTALGLLSFVLSIYLTQHAPPAAFYLLPPRAAELLIGAVLVAAPAWSMRRVWAEMLAGFSLGMIGFAVVRYDTSTAFPGLAAALPCLGAAGLIVAGRSQVTLVTRGLQLPPVVWIGLISYSLYLWHWPIFVMAKYYAMRDLTALERAIVLFASFVLAALSWRFVEQPVRRRTVLLGPRRLFAAAGAATGILVAVGVVIVSTNGLPQRLPANVVTILNPETYLHPYRDCHSRDPARLEKFDVCHIGDPTAAPSFLILGDSHADMLVPAIADAARAVGRSGVIFTSAGCAPELGTRPARGRNEQCRRTQMAALAYMRAHPEVTDIIAGGYWRRQADGSTHDSSGAFRVDDQSTEVSAAETLAVFRRGMMRLVTTLPCRNIYLIEDSPEAGIEPPDLMARLMYLGRKLDINKFAVRWANYAAAQAPANAVLTDLAHADRVTYVPVDDVLCPQTPEHTMSGARERVCPIIRDGRILYRNGDHLSANGAALLLDRFKALLSGQLSSTGSPAACRGDLE
jgi:peptidoglycan/LPS O-acetylase OafA/YrhL